MAGSKIYSGMLVDESMTFTLAQLCQNCNVHAEVIIEMVEYGVFEPVGSAPNEWQFPPIALERSQVVLRLRHDLGVNMAGAALVIDLLDEVNELRNKIALLEKQHPSF